MAKVTLLLYRRKDSESGQLRKEYAAMREVMGSIHYRESIVVFVEDEFAASGYFAEAAFFDDVLGAEVFAIHRALFDGLYPFPEKFEN